MGALVRAEELGNEAAQKKFVSFVGIGSAVLGILGAIVAAIPGLGLKQLGQMAMGGFKGAAIVLESVQQLMELQLQLHHFKLERVKEKWLLLPEWAYSIKVKQ